MFDSLSFVDYAPLVIFASSWLRNYVSTNSENKIVSGIAKVLDIFALNWTPVSKGL